MKQKMLAAALAVAACVGFTPRAAAQEAEGIDFSAFGRRLTDLEKEHAALKARVAAIEAKPASNPNAKGCQGCGGQCLSCGKGALFCPCVPIKASGVPYDLPPGGVYGFPKTLTPADKAPPPKTVAPPAAVSTHSHTCPKCATSWSHSGQPGDDNHNCPRCGTYQNVVSGFSPPSLSPGVSYFVGSGSGGCANGSCSAGVRYAAPAPQFQPLGGLFRRR